ncbi:MAG TPA: serine hydrolase domain-containing protein [Acidobacteriota bacterium]|nr:serine hydrolase domain-containing protein [Acidobacteriota bacterium]
MKLDIQRLADCIENQAEPEPFSGVVYLTKGAEVLFERACGFAIKSESIINKIDTRFQMASGCKIFTGVAICQLVESGKLGFDSLLSENIDAEFPNYSPDITIHQLLTHSSGITSYFEEDVDPDYEALWRNTPIYNIRSPKDFLPLFQSKHMKFSPGEKFEYNDAGFILLGLVVESITGIDFSEYIRQNVFNPAGMRDSGYFSTDQLPERTAYAYIKKNDGTWRTNFFAVPITGAPDGGAYTTAPDMAKFWRALLEGRLLGDEMTGQMMEAKIVSLSDPTSSHYGYGVWIDQSDGKKRKVLVVGYDPGVAMKSACYLDESVTLTVMGNTSEALWPMYRKIEMMLGL